MKRILFSIIIPAALTWSACSVKEVQNTGDVSDGKEMTFTGVVMDEGTKTAVQSNSAVWWTPGDAIKVFHGPSSGSKFTADITRPSALAKFKGKLADKSLGDDYYWAVYPSSAARACDGKSITAVLSDQQTAKAGSFAPNTNITVARSATKDLSFYNVCSGMWFTVTHEGIQSVTLKGNADENVAGAFLLTMTEGSRPIPAMPVVLSGEKSITLSAPEGESFQVGDKYYIVLLPQTFSKGVTLTFETETEKGQRVYNGNLVFERSLFKYSENADQNVVFVPKGSESTSYIQVKPGGGRILLPDDVGKDDAVVLDFTQVTEQNDYTIEYSTQAGAKKPGLIYVVGEGNSSVGVLSGDLASSTVHLLSGKYVGTAFTTALSTLVIELGVQVGTVNVNGGSVMVNGAVTSLNVSEDAASGDGEEDKIIIIINNTISVVSVEETNCSLQVASDGQVTVLDTQAKETEIIGLVGDLTAGENAGNVIVQEGGVVTGTLDTKAQETSVIGTVADLTAREGAGSVTVQEGGVVTGTLDTKAQETSVIGTVADLTAGEDAGSVTVQEGGTVTGTLDTKAGTTTIDGGAIVNDVAASGEGSLTVKDGATVDSVSATGDVSVEIADNVQTRTGDIPAYLVTIFSQDIEAIPKEGVASITVSVTSNVAWSFSFPETVYWIQADGTLSGNGEEQSFTLSVMGNSGVLARKAPLTFSFGENKQVTHSLLQAGSDGFTSIIEDWGDGGDGEFDKK